MSKKLIAILLCTPFLAGCGAIVETIAKGYERGQEAQAVVGETAATYVSDETAESQKTFELVSDSAVDSNEKLLSAVVTEHDSWLTIGCRFAALGMETFGFTCPDQEVVQ